MASFSSVVDTTSFPDEGDNCWHVLNLDGITVEACGLAAPHPRRQRHGVRGQHVAGTGSRLGRRRPRHATHRLQLTQRAESRTPPTSRQTVPRSNPMAKESSTMPICNRGTLMLARLAAEPRCSPTPRARRASTSRYSSIGLQERRKKRRPAERRHPAPDLPPARDPVRSDPRSGWPPQMPATAMDTDPGSPRHLVLTTADPRIPRDETGAAMCDARPWE